MYETIYHIAGSAFDKYPIETHFGLFSLEDGSMAEIPQQFPFDGLRPVNFTSKQFSISNQILYICIFLIYF